LNKEVFFAQEVFFAPSAATSGEEKCNIALFTFAYQVRRRQRNLKVHVDMNLTAKVQQIPNPVEYAAPSAISSTMPAPPVENGMAI
jgi:hypothetical protein